MISFFSGSKFIQETTNLEAGYIKQEVHLHTHTFIVN